MGPRDIHSLANHVCTLLHQENIDAQDVLFLRNLPAAPRKLVGPGGLSDNDLSLIVLGTRLAGQGKPVYLLTNDQDLLAFASWVRTRPDARTKWATIGDLQALHGLTYLEHIHRDCKIQTQQMRELLNFALIEHYSRTDLAGTAKGTSIMQQLVGINSSLDQSVQIKLALKGGMP